MDIHSYNTKFVDCQNIFLQNSLRSARFVGVGVREKIYHGKKVVFNTINFIISLLVEVFAQQSQHFWDKYGSDVVINDADYMHIMHA